MKSIRIRLLQYLNHTRGLTFTEAGTYKLLGKTYHLIKGTLRPTPDYDDAWLLALSQEAKFVFDIGSNIGQAALLMLHSGDVQQIILVDPDPDALSKAAFNLVHNGLSHKARFVCAFVSDQSDQLVDFYSIMGGAASSMYAGHAVTASSQGKKVKVVTTTIDQMVRDYGIQPDLIKIDTEGAERLVLQGASELAKLQTTRFMVEMHSNPELSMRENAQAVLDWASRANYRAWYLKEKNLLTSPEKIANRGRCHLLLLPSNANLPPSIMKLGQSATLEDVFPLVKQ